MKGILAAALLLCAASAVARTSSSPPLYDPVLLNIGLVCRWNMHCMDAQTRSMQRALKYVRKENPPQWKLQLCNKNAGRKRDRVDWIGFDNCIRNGKLRPQTSNRPARHNVRDAG
jgi:hypothetical protein